LELIKIGDTAVSEEKIVETTTMASPEEKGRANPKKNQHPPKRPPLQSKPEVPEESSLFVKRKTRKLISSKITFILFLSNAKLLET